MTPSLRQSTRLRRAVAALAIALAPAVIDLSAARAADTYVLASTEKGGAISPYRVLGVGDVTAIVTDAAPDDPLLAQLSERGTAVISAAA